METFKKIRNILTVVIPIALFAFGKSLSEGAKKCEIISTTPVEAVVTNQYSKKEYEEDHRNGKTIKRTLIRCYVEVNYGEYKATFRDNSTKQGNSKYSKIDIGSTVDAYLMTIEYEGKEYTYLDDNTNISNGDFLYIKSLKVE